jgi:hypothetical protein
MPVLIFSMNKFLTTVFFLIPLISLSQTDVLILQKNGRNIKTFETGMPIGFHTVYDQWLGGTITALRNDSIFLNDIPFHVHEIDAIRQDNAKWNYLTDGTLLIVAGVGVLVLNVVNGLYTNESAGSWIKTSGWITAGAFIIGGILLRRARYSDYKIGKKYTLHYLNMHVNNPVENNPSVKPTEPAK